MKTFWNWLKSLKSKEPSLLIGVIMSLVGVLITFGVPITPEFQETLEDALWVIIPLIMGGALLTRQSVYPPARVEVVSDQGDLPVAGPASPIPDGVPVMVVPR